MSHLYGPSSLEKWLPSEEEDTQVASQEEEEEELFPAAALHALLHRPQQQHRTRRRQRPLGGRRQRQQLPSQQHHRNQRPRRRRSGHRCRGRLEARRAIRDSLVSGGLLQVPAVAPGTGYLGGPGEEPFVSCSCKTDPTTGAVSDRWGVCDCTHTSARTCAWLHRRLR